MVVDRKRLFRVIVVALERADAWIRGENSFELKAQLAAEQQFVVTTCQWIAPRRAGNRAIQSIARDRDQIGGVEDGDQPLSFALAFLVIELELLERVVRRRAAMDVQWQCVI